MKQHINIPVTKIQDNLAKDYPLVPQFPGNDKYARNHTTQARKKSRNFRRSISLGHGVILHLMYWWAPGTRFAFAAVRDSCELWGLGQNKPWTGAK